MTHVDTYALTARLAPALVIVSPVLVWLFPTWLTGPQKWVSAAGNIGGWLVVALVVRRIGRWRQPTLLRHWGGDFPTTTALLLSDQRTPMVTKHRWRTQLEALYGQSLPTAQEEAADPRAARARIRDAERVLRAKVNAQPEATRLAHTENRSYGFLRNTWALKPLGLPLAGFVLAACITLGWTSGWTTHLWVSAASSLATCLAWLFVFTPSFIRITAQDYTERLFDGLEQLPKP